MGRGNVCTFNPYEGLWYIDHDYIDWYERTYSTYGLDDDSKLLCDIEYDELTSGDWKYDYFRSEDELDELLDNFIRDFRELYPSFTAPKPYSIRYGCEYATVILENELFRIATLDNQWSVAIMLLQKEDPYDDHLSGLQKRHYKRYLVQMASVLLDYLPVIGTYKGAWTSGQLTAAQFAKGGVIA